MVRKEMGRKEETDRELKGKGTRYLKDGGSGISRGEIPKTVLQYGRDEGRGRYSGEIAVCWIVRDVACGIEPP